MVKVIFINNEIIIGKTSDSNIIRIRKLWSKLREDYTDWIAKVRLKDFGQGKPLVRLLQWEGMSTWWFNQLVVKGVEKNRRLHRLMILYLLKEFKNNIDLSTDDKLLLNVINLNFPQLSISFRYNKKIDKNNIKLYFPKLSFCLLCIRSIINDIIKYFSLSGLKKRQINRYKNLKSSIWFQTNFPANWIISDNDYYERHYSDAINLDQSYSINSRYLAYIFKYDSDKMGILKLKKMINECEQNTGKEFIFVEAHLRLKDIIKSYFSTLKEYIEFKSWEKSTDFKKLFILDGIDVSSVLIETFDSSYTGLIQYSKLHGLALARFIVDTKCSPQTIVGYTEFFSECRGDYHFLKKYSPNSRFISIQHSRATRNYGATYNRKSEFDDKLLSDNVMYCPKPDYFLANGQQYKNILKEFYPAKSIKIIGSLRQDGYIKNNLKNKSSLRKYSSIKNYLLVCFSTNDSEWLVKFVKDIILPKDWSVIVTPHPKIDKNYLQNIIEFNWRHLDVIIDLQNSTIKILPYVKLLLCGMSNLAFESGIWGVRSVRAMPLGIFPPQENDQFVPEFHSGLEFNSWFETNKKTLSKKSREEWMNQMINNYYYKVDGKSKERLWEFLVDQPDLPHNTRP